MPIHQNQNTTSYTQSESGFIGARVSAEFKDTISPNGRVRRGTFGQKLRQVAEVMVLPSIDPPVESRPFKSRNFGLRS